MACRAFSKYDFRCNTKVDCVPNNLGSLVMLSIFLQKHVKKVNRLLATVFIYAGLLNLQAIAKTTAITAGFEKAISMLFDIICPRMPFLNAAAWAMISVFVHLSFKAVKIFPIQTMP